MKVIEFKNDEKEIDWLIDEIKKIDEQEGIEVLVCVYKKKNNVVSLGATRASAAEHIGLLEIGKAQLIDDLEDA